MDRIAQFCHVNRNLPIPFQKSFGCSVDAHERPLLYHSCIHREHWPCRTRSTSPRRAPGGPTPSAPLTRRQAVEDTRSEMEHSGEVAPATLHQRVPNGFASPPGDTVTLSPVPLRSRGMASRRALARNPDTRHPMDSALSSPTQPHPPPRPLACATEARVDVLVDEPGAQVGLAFITMQDELSKILGRRVDMNTFQGVEEAATAMLLSAEVEYDQRDDP